MLGVPLGSGDFVSRYVKGKLLDGTIKVMAKLAEFEDLQSVKIFSSFFFAFFGHFFFCFFFVVVKLT